MKKSIIFLIVGIILLSIGYYQNTKYEKKSIVVNATITRIKSVDDTDDGPVSYRHTYYGSYTVNGKEYTDKKLETKYNSSYIPDNKVGDTIEIRVDPGNPGKQVPEGGLIIMSGMGITIISIICIIADKKKRHKTDPAT